MSNRLRRRYMVHGFFIFARLGPWLGQKMVQAGDYTSFHPGYYLAADYEPL
jgi:hypothetical protein